MTRHKEIMMNKVHCGDNIELMQKLPNNSIDMVITSPPYWSLRHYGECADKIWGGDKDCKHEWGSPYTRHQEAPGKTSLVKQKGLEYTVTSHTCTRCGAWRGEFGQESHPQMYIDHLVEICREVKRILKPSGSFYLNLGDSYYNDSTEKNKGWLQSKQLLFIPGRVVCGLQDDGWILRNNALWLKPNPMPTPVKDRLNNTYEHIFFFVNSLEYFYHPIGENPDDVFEITVKPFRGAHFAVFPPELVKKPIEISCPERICMKCGKPFSRMSFFN